ncbi:hypothetical protein [Deinococcus carri]|uniref:hypothetical protein n=1 Tax=Deinococcus carri TaxID=1211323 RepID=UPI0031EF3274
MQQTSNISFIKLINLSAGYIYIISVALWRKEGIFTNSIEAEVIPPGGVKVVSLKESAGPAPEDFETGLSVVRPEDMSLAGLPEEIDITYCYSSTGDKIYNITYEIALPYIEYESSKLIVPILRQKENN